MSTLETLCSCCPVSCSCHLSSYWIWIRRQRMIKESRQPAYCYYRQSAAFRMFFLPNLLLLLLWMNACNETAVLFLAFIQPRRIREETKCWVNLESKKHEQCDGCWVFWVEITEHYPAHYTRVSRQPALSTGTKQGTSSNLIRHHSTNASCFHLSELHAIHQCKRVE